MTRTKHSQRVNLKVDCYSREGERGRCEKRLAGGGRLQESAGGRSDAAESFTEGENLSHRGGCDIKTSWEIEKNDNS